MIMIAPPTQAQTLVWWSWSRGSVGDACRPVSPFVVCPSALIADGFELLTKHRHGRFEICLVLLQHITPRLPQHLPLVSRTSESREQVSQQGTSTKLLHIPPSWRYQRHPAVDCGVAVRQHRRVPLLVALQAA